MRSNARAGGRSVGWVVALAALAVHCSERASTGNPVDTAPSAVVDAAKRSGLAPRLGESAALARAGTTWTLDTERTRGSAFAVPRIRADVADDVRDGVRIELAGRPGSFLHVRPLDLSAVGAELVRDALVFREAARETDVLVAVEPSRVEELRWLRSPSSRYVARYRIELGPDLVDVSVREGRAIVTDAKGRVPFAMEPLVAVDAAGRRFPGSIRLSRESATFDLEATFPLEGATFPVVVDPAWTAAGDMAASFRIKANAFPLPDGRVVVGGGYGLDEKGTSTSEIFDPKTNTWTDGPVAPVTMKDAHAVPVGKNRWLLACDSTGNEPVLFDGNELPSGKFVTAGPLPGAKRKLCALASLPGDQALLVGGEDLAVGTSLASAYVWTAPTTWASTTSLPGNRVHPAAVALSTGEVLVTGGDSGSGPLNDALLYDPAKKTWSPAAALGGPAASGVAAALPGGTALLVDAAGSHLYDRTTNAWKHFAQPARTYATILPFGDHWVVAAGSDAVLDRKTFLFDPKTATFADGPQLLVPRGPAAGSTLPGAGVLLAGGSFGSLAERLGKLTGDACSADDECATSHCVDGVCCNAVCDGQCEACDVKGALGICYPVHGAPHGARSACDDGKTDPCRASTCDGTIDPKSCAAFTAGAETTCKMPSCTGASFSAASKCDGLGHCVAPAAVSCAPFACEAAGCKVGCTTTADCASGFDCRAGKCVAFENTCSDDRTTSIPHEGTPQSCTPYLCGTDGRCLKTCTATSDCAADHVCDPAVKSCIQVAPADSSSGGCDLGRSDPSGASGLVVAALAMLSIRRRNGGR